MRGIPPRPKGPAHTPRAKRAAADLRAYPAPTPTVTDLTPLCSVPGVPGNYLVCSARTPLVLPYLLLVAWLALRNLRNRRRLSKLAVTQLAAGTAVPASGRLATVGNGG